MTPIFSLMAMLQLTLNTNAQLVFDGDAVVGFFKLLFVVLALLYAVFAFVVTRQIKVMRTTLITSFSPLVKVIGYAHLGVALFVLMAFVLFL
jgi:hypothetical protein